MKTTVNLENDKFFIDLVEQDKLRVTRSGRVFNIQTGKQLGTSLKPEYAQIGWKIPGTKRVRHILVHRLVYLVHGEYELGNRIVNHKDGVKRNNHVDNLEPSGYTHNSKHAWESGLQIVFIKTLNRLKFQTGERSTSAKLTNKQALEIRVLHKQKRYTHAKLGSIYNTHASSITRILNWETYKEAKFKFRLNLAK